MKQRAATKRSFKLRRLGASDAASYRELRLEGLETHPEAFAASFEDEAARPLPWFEDLLENGIVFGGYTDGASLVGVAGLLVPTAAKLRHKGMLWGMFVRSDARGSGLAKILTERVIAHAEGVVEEVLLTVIASNIAAVRLYKGLGFEEYGCERRALKIDSDYHDELLLARQIEKSG